MASGQRRPYRGERQIMLAVAVKLDEIGGRQYSLDIVLQRQHAGEEGIRLSFALSVVPDATQHGWRA
jgi:hypothetical protein